MLPLSILNCISSIAEVVLKYPAVKSFSSSLEAVFKLKVAIKCFTNVVLDGLNKCNIPLEDSSFSSAPKLKDKPWNEVPCAWSPLVLYPKSELSSSPWYGLKTVDVIVSLYPLPPLALPWKVKLAPLVAACILLQIKIYSL